MSNQALMIYLLLLIHQIINISGDDTLCDMHDNTSCESSESAHNIHIQQEFSRQSKAFYEAAKVYKTDNLLPLISAANIQSNDIVLDLACGPGLITTEVAKKNPKKVYGMDITQDMLNIATEHAKENNVLDQIEFIQGNVEQLPFDDNSLDIVITRWTFHHFDKLQTVLNEIYRVLKPQTGKLVFLEFCAPNNTEHEGILNAFHTIRDPSHVWAYSEDGWIDALKNSAFKDETINIVDRFSTKMNWKEFIEWTNPDENDKRARESMYIIGKYMEKCECNVGMNFFENNDKELMFTSNYIVVIATKT